MADNGFAFRWTELQLTCIQGRKHVYSIMFLFVSGNEWNKRNNGLYVSLLQRKNDNERRANCIFKIIRVMELKLHDQQALNKHFNKGEQKVL